MALRSRSALMFVVGTTLGLAGCVPKQTGRVVQTFPPPPPSGLQTVLATDAAGNQVLAGAFRGELVIDGHRLVSVGATDIFVVKTGPSGFGPERFGGSGDDAATGAAIDSDGSVIIAGTFEGAATFGQQAVRAETRHPAQRAVFVARLDPTGKVVWVRQIATSNVPTQVSVSIEADHSILVGVSATGTLSNQNGPVRLAGESIMLDHLSGAGEKLPLPPNRALRVESLEVGCAHSPCKTGAALASGCGLYGCVADICTFDSYCCSTLWDSICVSEMANCPRRCDCSQVRTAGTAFYPDASRCTVAICSEQSACCDTLWDSTCVAMTYLPSNLPACSPMCQ